MAVPGLLAHGLELEAEAARLDGLPIGGHEHKVRVGPVAVRGALDLLLHKVRVDGVEDDAERQPDGPLPSTTRALDDRACGR